MSFGAGPIGGERWRGKYDFLLIAHEHLYVFRKPGEGESATPFKESMRWR